MKQVVIGVFDNSTDAQESVQQLINQGFDNENIDISYQDGREENLRENDLREENLRDEDTRENSFGDKISNFFKSLFGDSVEASSYTDVVRRNREGSVVAVYVDSLNKSEKAARILDEYGAIDVNERANEYRTSQTDTFTTGNRFTDTPNENITSDTSIPIIEEELEVGKREIRTGGVKLRSRIVERPVEETIRLRVEHVNVERERVNRPASEEDLSNFRENTIEVTERAETPIVKKESRVVEEIRLNKEIEEKEETIRETVRKMDVDIENINPENEDESRNRDITDERNR